MPFEQHQEKNYPLEAGAVYQAALKVTEKLGGSLVASAPEKFHLEAKFPKTILGQTLGERTYLTLDVRPQAEGSQVVLEAYPLDAVDRKLMFGARKGVTQTVVMWFTAHLEHTLGVTA